MSFLVFSLFFSMSTKRTGTLTNRSIPILAYHSIEASSWKYAVEPSLFEEHLGFLKTQGYTSLTLADYAQSEGLALSSKPFVLTFNGGFRNFEAILSVLQKYDFKATIFVSTAYVGKKSQWMNSHDGTATLLDWEALAAMGKMGIEIASHGHEHLQLDVIPEVLARHDISYSKVLLEDKLGQPCLTFAYPYGYYNTQVRDLIRNAGYSLACSMEERVSTSESDIFALPRLVMTNSLNAGDLKYLVRQKDSGGLNPYSSLKLSVSRQLRRWNTPLRDVQDNSYIEVENHNSQRIPEDSLEQNLSDVFIVSNSTSEPFQDEVDIETKQESIYVALEPLHPAPLHPELPLQEDQVTMVEKALTPERQQLELQGEYLASCKAVLLAYPDTSLLAYPDTSMVQYQRLFNVVALLQESQENDLLFEDFEQIQEAYKAFELAVANNVNTRRQFQQKQIKGFLNDLQHPATALLQPLAERVKIILESHRVKLEQSALSDVEIKSMEAIMLNFKQRLDLSYRQELTRLVQKATKVNALEVLKEIQIQARMLEQGQFPNIAQLKQYLLEKIARDKSAKLIERKVRKFNDNLEEVLNLFARIKDLNNEDVYNVSSMVKHLSEQQLHFPHVSNVIQDELILLLKEAKAHLKQLIKEHQTTSLVALQILTSDTFEKTFSIFDQPPAIVTPGFFTTEPDSSIMNN